MNRTLPDERFATPATLTIETPEDIGKLLRQRRKELRIRQADLAEACGMSPRLLGEIERGKSGVAVGKILRIASNIGIDLVLHVRGKDEPWS